MSVGAFTTLTKSPSHGGIQRIATIFDGAQGRCTCLLLEPFVLLSVRVVIPLVPADYAARYELEAMNGLPKALERFHACRRFSRAAAFLALG